MNILACGGSGYIGSHMCKRFGREGYVPLTFGDAPHCTCIRDYVHVDDLCDAHLRALGHLQRSPGFHVFILDSGQDRSAAEVLASCREECGGKPESEFVKRHTGDPAVLVANNQAAAATLPWGPRHGLSHCLETALAWHARRSVVGP